MCLHGRALLSVVSRWSHHSKSILSEQNEKHSHMACLSSVAASVQPARSHYRKIKTKKSLSHRWHEESHRNNNNNNKTNNLNEKHHTLPQHNVCWPVPRASINLQRKMSPGFSCRSKPGRVIHTHTLRQMLVWGQLRGAV